jgi:ABC-type glycerol-3-phosphate transport system substrate-binding protein
MKGESKMKKRAISLIVIMLMVLAMFSTGCTTANNGETQDSTTGQTTNDNDADDVVETNDPDEIVELEFMRLDPSWDPIEWGEDPVTRRMTERTGVKLKCLAPSGEGDQVANVMLLSGDYPEIINGYSMSMYAKYVSAGALYSIDELVEKYGYPEILDGSTIPLASQAVHRSADGKLYAIPEWFSEDGFGSVGQIITVRNDIYNDLGKPTIDNMDDFYDVLQTIRDSNITYKDIKMWPLAVHWVDSAILGDIANIYGSKIYRFINFCLSDEGQILDFYGVEGETMEYRDGVPYLMDGVYEEKLADWTGYAKKTGVRLWDRMKSQKWNWERQVEAPVRAANRAMSAKYAFDATYLKPLQVDSTTPEGILYAEIETNIIPQLTEIIIDPDGSKIESSIQELLEYYEGKGLDALENVWTEQYNRITDN